MRSALLGLLLALGCGGSPEPALPSAPPELTAGQRATNAAGTPLRAIALPFQLLFHDAPVGLWQLAMGEDPLDATLARLEAGDAQARLAAAERVRRGARTLDDADRRRAAVALLARLDDDVAGVRNQALLGLAALEAGWAAPRMAAALKDVDPQVRGSAVIALGALGEARLGPLLPTLWDSPWGEHGFVQAAIVQAAGQLRLEALRPRIRALLDDDPDDPRPKLLRVVAIQALGRLGDQEAVAPLLDQLASDSPYVRAAAARALGELGRRDLLLQALSRATAAEAQLPLILALARHGQPADRPVLTRLLASPDPRVRAHAAGALVDLREPAGVDALIAGVGSGEVYERLYCLGRLERLAGASYGFVPSRWSQWWDEQDRTLPEG